MLPVLETLGPAEQAAVERFMAAVSTGDVQGLVEVLAPDVVLITDGGLVAAARKPISGVEKVVAFVARAAKVPDFVATTGIWWNWEIGAVDKRRLVAHDH
jgi:SnoaL-like domain